ncbi:PQQ-binding-like beta-propeller repeat protein [Marinifilum caeruleilacunae]|uniref:PKD domain-containing protein n=1 Tax=Marinifilum caeruleilacunae TaxID=2499076 RepID=A0ABX1WRN0_9BACT|nr:PQQ-binding-like beta-propeller repeat protein [Marinifilum caeruleilacunae]NOU58716.1 PKD domain-containing protein [Marinifilum caeruleilacunae]
MKNKYKISVTTLAILAMNLLLASCDDEPGSVHTIEPTAKFSVEAEKMEAEQKIIFKSLSNDEDGFITSCQWNLGDGTTATGEKVEHFYAVGGEYTVSLVATDNTGSSGEAATKTITIADAPAAGSIEPEKVWSFDLPGKVHYSSPAIGDDGTLYIGFNQATRENGGPNLFAIKDGSKVWEHAFLEGSANKSDKVSSSPAISEDGSLYMASFYSRNIFKLNAGTGAVDGEFYTDARIRYSCPVFAADGTVYVGGYSKGGKGFYSVNAPLTTQNWVFQAGEDFNSTPAVASDGTIYVSSTNDYIYAVNPDGTEKWNAQYGTWSATAIAIGADETVYFAGETSTGGVLIAFNPADGTEKWRVDLPQKVSHGGPAIASDGTIYLGGYEEKLKAYNPDDGSEKWSYTANGAIEVVPAIDNDGNIYFGDKAGFFHVVNPDGEKQRKTIKIGDEIISSAAIDSNGIIYVAANEGEIGKVFAYRTDATGPASGGWPMYAKDAKHSGRK